MRLNNYDKLLLALIGLGGWEEIHERIYSIGINKYYFLCLLTKLPTIIPKRKDKPKTAMMIKIDSILFAPNVIALFK